MGDSEYGVAQLQQHDPYDAKSRSKDFLRPLPSSLLYEDDANRIANIERIDLNVKGSRAFELRDVLSVEECQHLIDSTNEIGYQHSDVKSEYPKHYRNNHRLIIINEDLAYAIWRRILPHLKQKDIENVTPLGWATEGIWLPVMLNDCFLFSKYDEGSFFRPHYDGMYKNVYGECSIFTVTFYLNSDFDGGRLLFLDDKDVKPEDIPDRVKGLITGAQPDVLHAYQPSQGSALIFNHDTFHEGEVVKRGVKYIARSSIMFRKVQDLTDPKRTFEQDPMWQRSKSIFASFPELLAKGDTYEFTMKFLEAQSLQLKHGRCLHPPPVMPDTLPLDILFYIFKFLDHPKDYAALTATCKAWNNMLRSGSVWKDLYTRSWGAAACRVAKRAATFDFVNTRELPDEVHDDLLNWYGFYRNRYCLEHQCSSIFSYVGGKAYAMHNGKTFVSAAKMEEDSSPWDNSFSTIYTTDYGSENHFCFKKNKKKGDHSEVKVRARWLNEIWTEQFELCESESSSNKSIILVVHPLIWDSRVEWPLVKYNWNRTSVSCNSFGNVPSQMIPNDKYIKKCIRTLRREHSIEAVSMIDAELSILYANERTSGIVIYEFEELFPSGKQVVWEIVAYCDKIMVDSFVFVQQTQITSTTVERIVAETRHLIDTHFVDQKSPVFVALGSTHSYDPNTFNYSYERYKKENLISCELRNTIAQDILQGLSSLDGVVTKLVTPNDILAGAEMYHLTNSNGASFLPNLLWASDLFYKTLLSKEEEDGRGVAKEDKEDAMSDSDSSTSDLY
eukprot:TRINITY_DN5046_c0_g1_i2.p1 TRINITY_DN5046_c0_g1~~TRINITY_DN5046_c0_g1_i2.p1  ORF type:complete len:785 (+),score=152.83 TRINITY_DN5046_c0_g1_i2:217-2571(+)